MLADFLVYDHSKKHYMPCQGKVLEKDNDGEYNWNSCRYIAACNSLAGCSCSVLCLLYCKFSKDKTVVWTA